MSLEAERTKTFKRRLFVLAALKTAAFGALGARLYQLQVQQADEFAVAAEDNRANQRLIVPPRGRILDAKGRVLARNVPTYRLRIIRERTDDLRQTLVELSQHINLPDDLIEDVIKRAYKRRDFVPIVIREDLGWEEVARISVRAPELPGIELDSRLLRDYPHGPVLAHVIGYVAPVTEKEQRDDQDPILTIPEFRIGKSGIEKAYEKRLRGKVGLSRVEVNAIGREIRELDRVSGKTGDTVNLTLDLDLQQFCYDRLSNELAASAVVMEVSTGAVKALASVPSYDPGVFNTGLSQRQWREWRDNPRTPLVNKSIRGQYPPGSTFKMITGLAAIENNIVSPQYEVYCPGFMRLGRSRFHCWKAQGHGSLGLVQALSQSCDVYFYDIARKIGVDGIAAMARKFGLGERTNIDLPGENPGLIPTTDWKLAAVGEPWQKGETVITGIGQGFVSATPLQLVTMTSRMCNGGFAVSPYFHKDHATPDPDHIGVSQESLDWVKLGMWDVINGRRGTARKAKLPDKSIEMAGKTGTSQVKRITRSERASGAHKKVSEIWKHRDHALFVCFAPFDRPKFAVAVIVEHGKSGSKAAAPIARDIMGKALKLYPEPQPDFAKI